MNNLGDTIVFSDPDQYRKVRAFIDGEVTCKSCKFYVKEYKDLPIECTNEKTREIVDADAGFMLCPPSDFSCSLWEKKV